MTKLLMINAGDLDPPHWRNQRAHQGKSWLGVRERDLLAAYAHGDVRAFVAQLRKITVKPMEQRLAAYMFTVPPKRDAADVIEFCAGTEAAQDKNTVKRALRGLRARGYVRSGTGLSRSVLDLDKIEADARAAGWKPRLPREKRVEPRRARVEERAKPGFVIKKDRKTGKVLEVWSFEDGKAVRQR